MADQHYVIPPPHRPWFQRISADRWLSIAAILAALLAAGFTGWYAWDTHGLRFEAQEAAKKQAQYVKLSAEAAQKSADAAVLLAEGMKQSAEAGKDSAALARQSVEAYRQLVRTQQKQGTDSVRMFQLDQRPRLTFDVSVPEGRNVHLAPPTPVVVRIKNIGKTPAIDSQVRVWAAFAEQVVLSYPPASLYPAILTIGEGTIDIGVASPGPNAASSGNLRLFVYGLVTFHDALGSDTSYSEDFCLFYRLVWEICG